MVDVKAERERVDGLPSDVELSLGERSADPGHNVAEGGVVGEDHRRTSGHGAHVCLGVEHLNGHKTTLALHHLPHLLPVGSAGSLPR